MKPVKLRFSGLNSYRTLQEVDFETIGADGLFGIFGPTGSGKSSILDAITLVLYGGVDRASNNTRGIINQLEKSLEVSFEFELGGERYLVERRYERNPKDPDAALAKQARLRKITAEGEAVLASRPQEVTAKVEAILGIGKDEFSRAVVLPQGKFDQFLRLTGGDRAAMLEHLFNLEQYGEELAAKVKREAAVVNEQLQRIEGEIQGLGDCSPDTVNQAMLDLKVKHEECLMAQRTFELTDQSFNEAEAVRELFLKRQSALEKLEQLDQEHDSMEAKQSRLNAAERAEPLRELLVRQKELTRRIVEENNSYQQKLELHSKAVKTYEEAEKAFEIAENNFQEGLPRLQELKAKYQEAQEKQKKRKELQGIIAEKQRELELLRVKNSSTALEIETSKRVVAAAQAALDQLQQERSQLLVDPDEKEAVENALNLLVRLEEIEKRYQEAKDFYTKRKSQHENSWTALLGLVQRMAPDQTVSTGADLEKYVKAVRHQAEKEVDEARKKLQRALIANSAAELVKELHDGEPCPVCGSREHPSPARATGELGRIENELKAVEGRLRQVREWEDELLKGWHDWRTNESLLQESREQLEEIEVELKNAAAAFEKARRKYGRDELRHRKREFLDFEKQLHLLDQKREELRKTQLDSNQKLQNLNDSYRNDKVKEASLQAELANYQSQLEEIIEGINQITGGAELNDLIRDLAQKYEQLDTAVKERKSKVAEARAAMETLAREIAALNATLNASRRELEVVEARLSLGLKDAGFMAIEEAEAVLLEPAERETIRRQLEQYRQEVAVSRNELERFEREINQRRFEAAAFEELKEEREKCFQALEQLKTETALAQKRLEELRGKQERWNELQGLKVRVEKRKTLAEDLLGLIRGRRFVSFLAQEHLREMTLEASYQLGRLTGQRYALELAKDKDCEFVIRDDYNGGNRRAVNSLSGGEIFMTSLALALALSSKIQLRGKYPLGFFFLDEGFGSLDEEKLDKVMSALEKLPNKNRIVGVISHVREMKERLPKYLEVVPAGEDGNGSRIRA